MTGLGKQGKEGKQGLGMGPGLGWPRGPCGLVPHGRVRRGVLGEGWLGGQLVEERGNYVFLLSSETADNLLKWLGTMRCLDQVPALPSPPALAHPRPACLGARSGPRCSTRIP